jgi:hypothetical protein
MAQDEGGTVMLKQVKIERMFRDMGLETEVERSQFSKFVIWESTLSTNKEQIFIHAASTTSADEEEDENGELE